MYLKLISLVLLLLSPHSLAYIGPGMGGGFFAVVIGVIAAFIIAIFGFIYFPLKRWLNERKKK